MAKEDSPSTETLEVKIDAIKSEIQIHRESFQEHQRVQRDRYDDFKNCLTLILEKNDIIESELADANSKLAEYNTQLQIHIQGVIQLKEMNTLLREEIKIFREKTDAEVKEINSRLSDVEIPFKWVNTTSSFAEKVFSILKFAAIIAVLLGAGKSFLEFFK